jgi:hypothetical protein
MTPAQLKDSSYLVGRNEQKIQTRRAEIEDCRLSLEITYTPSYLYKIVNGSK